MKRRLTLKSSIDSFEILEKEKSLLNRKSDLKNFDEMYYLYSRIFIIKDNYSKGIFFERNDFYNDMNKLFGFFYTNDIDSLVLKVLEKYDFKSIEELVENVKFMEDEKKSIDKLVHKIYLFFFDSNFILNYYYLHSLLSKEELIQIEKITKEDDVIVELINKSAALIYEIPDEFNLNKKLSFIQVEFNKKDVDIKHIRDNVLEIAGNSIGYSYNVDDIIIKEIESIYDLEKIIEQMTKRLRDMVAIFDYELSLMDQDELLNRLVNNEFSKNRIGKKECDMTDSINFAKTIIENKKTLESLSSSLEKTMIHNYPNLTYVAGHKIGASLISHAGSFFTLFIFPTSTIQLIGAETALFRHLVTNAKPPKHGLIANHPFVLKAKNKGRIARKLAALISRATKYDFAKRGLIIEKEFEKLEKEDL
ncbi:MAG: hypothetical protein PHT94_03765 [Candidatus Nanoarchaeia archaeon]|nr:hypothetical protein [Candidatus Nanoarchaeia archaeon]